MFQSPVRREQIEPLRQIVVAMRRDNPLYYMLPLDEQWAMVNEYAVKMGLQDED